ncbi:MAG: protein kinase [Planctomycetes bacterium]|nr:protein kinase [Planctomycetota bacterium]
MPDELERILARCIDVAECEGRTAVEAILEDHPHLAVEIRELLDSLEDLEMLQEAGDGTRPAVTFGDFALLHEIGRGGMGVVHLARQISVDRIVALKVMHAQLTGNPRLVERFRREAKALAKVDHPNVVRVLASGEHDGCVWIAMNYVPGRTLDVALSVEPDRRVSLRRQAVSWIRDIARALEAALAACVFHRDVKPANIRITPHGTPVLLDFGLAKDSQLDTLTKSGNFQGTTSYAAPEQIEGSGDVDARSDVYSLGVTLFEALCMRLPYEGRTTAEVLQKILHAPMPRVRSVDPGIPRELETIVGMACERQPIRRYATAAAFADDLDRYLNLRPIRARPPTTLRRVRLWARRNRFVAASILFVLVAAIAIAGVLGVRDARRVAENRGEAAAIFDTVERELQRLASERIEVLSDAERLQLQSERFIGRYVEPETWSAHVREQTAWRAKLGERAALRSSLLASLERAVLLDPAADARANDARARVYLETWRLATAQGKAAEASFAASMVARFDASPGMKRLLDATTTVTFASNVEGTRVSLFRFELESALRDDGEERLVPIPWSHHVDATEGVGPEPGKTLLRVVAASDPLRVGDLIATVEGRDVADSVFIATDKGKARRGDLVALVDGRPVRGIFDCTAFGTRGDNGETEVLPAIERTYEIRGSDGRSFEVRSRALSSDYALATAAMLLTRGGVRVGVWRNGEVAELDVRGSVECRSTAIPCVRTRSSHVGVTPDISIDLPRGSYVAWFESDGFEASCHPFEVGVAERTDGGMRNSRAELRIDVELLPDGTSLGGFRRIAPLGIWMLEREVVAGDYVRFLNDPETLARIDAAEQPVLYPRDAATIPSGGLWRRVEGRYDHQPAPAMTPLMGVSIEDAEAYATWLSDRAERQGRPWRFRLPTYEELETAAWVGKGRSRRYVYGQDFRPTWFKSLYSKPKPCVEPVLSYPIDESVFGIFDLTGSVREWTSTTFGPSRKAFGGSWQHATDRGFTQPSYSGSQTALTSTGFRLVAERVR